jgi:hypothetical protein
MPLFQRKNDTLDMIKPGKFASEKELQSLVESNLEEMFSCRFIDTEYSTGQVHAGRIDTLAISEDNNPVIIEYKVVESSQLVNQSLFYLSCLKDHKGDFEMVVQKAFPDEKVEIDWSNIRVLCLAAKADELTQRIAKQEKRIARHAELKGCKKIIKEIKERKDKLGEEAWNKFNNAEAMKLILARRERTLYATVEEYLAQYSRRLRSSLENLWEKYHQPLHSILKERDNASAELAGYLKELGYERKTACV